MMKREKIKRKEEEKRREKIKRKEDKKEVKKREK
jgi:hypothetical protein